MVLLSLYFLIKNINEITINTLLDAVFVLATTVYGGTALHKMVVKQLRENPNGSVL